MGTSVLVQKIFQRSQEFTAYCLSFDSSEVFVVAYSYLCASQGGGNYVNHNNAFLSTGCNKLTDQTLLYLRRISNVTLIDLRGCKQITRKACEHFISDLSINSLYCLSDEKLIQKIS